MPRRLSSFRLRPALRLDADFIGNSKMDAKTRAKMQASNATITEWKRRLERSEPNQRYCKAGPSQLPVDDAPSSKTREDELESAPPVQTDLAGFLERMIEDAKQAGDYDSMDGFGEDVKQSTSQDLIKPKDEPQVDDPDNLTENFPDDVSDSADEAPQSSCGDPSSTGTPASTSLQSRPSTPQSFDDLCSLMGKTTIQTSNQKSAMRITIPKAYKASISIEPSCHYDTVAFYKAGIERRLPTGEKRKRNDLGFKPHEVIKKGALYLTDLDVQCPLTGDIHPIFDEKHWTDCPHHVYEIIKPALLLASKLLTTPKCLQHFQTVLKGNRGYCFDTSFRKQKPCHRIKKDVPLTPESLKDLMNHIESMAGSITFQFLDATNSPTHANKYFATARMVPCHHSSSSISSTPEIVDRQSAIISLHTDFYVQAQKLCRLQYPDPAQVLRFQFFLAMNLMHEFAHAFEIACSPNEARKGMEVYMYDWLEAESGRALEKALFGGLVTVINARVDGVHGLCVVEWPEPGLKDRTRSGQADIWSVPMSFVNSLFQETFWEDDQSKNIGGKDFLIVPKTGAKSSGITSFTTAKFEEVLEEREMGCLELALREVEGVLQCPEIDEEDIEAVERRMRKKRRKIHVPRVRMKKMGRRACVTFIRIEGSTAVTGFRRMD